MKLGLTKKQLQEIIFEEIENQEFNEQESDPAAAQPESGTSDTQSGGQGYPEVGKWESGVNRDGPANQIGVTKWADVVGAKLTRGKANPLKEQEELNTPEIQKSSSDESEEIMSNFNKKFMTFKTPNTSQVENGTHLILPKSVNGKPTTFAKYQHPINPEEVFKSWVGTQWDSYIPDERHLNDVLPNDTLRSFTVNGTRYVASLKRVQDNPLRYQFYWYLDKDGQPYNQNIFVKESEIPEEYRYNFIYAWGEEILMVGSLLAAFFIPGIGGIALGVLLDLGAATIQLKKGNNWGAGISAILAFLPVIGEIANVGRVSNKTAERLIKQVNDVGSYKELVKRINSMGKTQDAYLLRQLLKDDPHRIVNLINDFLDKKLLGAITTKSEALNVVNHLNYLLKSGIITKVNAQKFTQRLGLKRFGFYFGGTVGIILGGAIAQTAYGIYLNAKLENNPYGLSENDMNLLNLADKAYKSNPKLYMDKINPVITGYLDKYEKVNPELLQKLMNGIHSEFIKNQNINPNEIGKKIESNY